MQTIHLRQFGTVLVSRPAGLESFNAIRPTLESDRGVTIDFEGVLTVTPSWFDEFLTNLVSFMKGRVELLPTDNPSMLTALPVLIEAHDDAVGEVLKRALARTNQRSPR
jgi:hypothetical protein